MHHNIPLRPWDVIGVDVFQLNNKNYLCLVDYHSKFLVVKKMDNISADSVIPAFKVVIAEYSIPKMVMSDAGGNFVAEKFKIFVIAST